MHPIVISLVSDNFIDLADLMMQSHAEHTSSDFDYVIFTIGNKVRPKSTQNNREVTTVESIIGTELTEKLASKYSIPEMCFALKPYMLQAVLSQGYSEAHYFDSDILFYSDMATISDHLEQAPIVLTPHRLTPSAVGDDELTLMQAGQFNAGFIGVKDSVVSQSFLGWWWERTSQLAFNEPALGMCGDQRWLDQVPILFPDACIHRDPGLNVGHWNIDERQLHNVENRWLIGTERLIFFHWSGFDPNNPTRLSVHSERPVDPTLTPLVQEYTSQMRSSGFVRPREKLLSRMLKLVRSALKSPPK